MDNQKLNTLSDEELLKLAESDLDKTLKFDLMNEAEKFCYYNGIAAGNDRVYAIVIYHKYVEWKRDDKPMAKQFFFREFSKLFTVKRGWLGRYYMMDGSKFDISKEAFLKARKKYKHKKRKKNV